MVTPSNFCSRFVVCLLLSPSPEVAPVALIGWAGVAFIFVYMLAFGGTWGPIAWAVPSEIYPTSIRAKGAAVGAAAIWFSNFLVGLITPPLNDAAPYGAFAFYAGMTFLGLIWTFREYSLFEL